MKRSMTDRKIGETILRKCDVEVVPMELEEKLKQAKDQQVPKAPPAMPQTMDKINMEHKIERNNGEDRNGA